MSNFDWSKVTVAQLRDVPQAVVGDDFELVVIDDHTQLVRHKLICAELVGGAGEHNWIVWTASPNELLSTLACLNRIANYLRMQAKSL